MEFIDFQLGQWRSDDFVKKYSKIFNIECKDDQSKIYRTAKPFLDIDIASNIKDETVKIDRINETYCFNSQLGNSNFSISFAFDCLTDLGLNALRYWFGQNTLMPLIFDELPFKTYMVKINGTPNISVIPFDVTNGKQKKRIYKGEGNISLIAYFPYGFSTNFDFKDGRILESYNSGLLEGSGLIPKSDWYEGYNGGDLNAPFNLIFQTQKPAKSFMLRQVRPQMNMIHTNKNSENIFKQTQVLLDPEAQNNKNGSLFKYQNIHGMENKCAAVRLRGKQNAYDTVKVVCNLTENGDANFANSSCIQFGNFNQTGFINAQIKKIIFDPGIEYITELPIGRIGGNTAVLNSFEMGRGTKGLSLNTPEGVGFAVPKNYQDGQDKNIEQISDIIIHNNVHNIQEAFKRWKGIQIVDQAYLPVEALRIFDISAAQHLAITDNKNNDYTALNDESFKRGQKRVTNLTDFKVYENIPFNILDEVFLGQTNLKSVYLGNKVETIGVSSFQNCTNLSDIQLQEKSELSIISANAFKGCSQLTDISFLKNATVKACDIGKGAFSDTGISTLTVSSGINEIYEGAFFGCTQLSEIKVDSNHNRYKIKNNVLYDNSSKKILLAPANLVEYDGSKEKTLTVGNYTFANCTAPIKIKLPKNTTIHDSSFFTINENVKITIEYQGSNLDWKAIEETLQNKPSMNPLITLEYNEIYIEEENYTAILYSSTDYPNYNGYAAIVKVPGSKVAAGATIIQIPKEINYDGKKYLVTIINSYVLKEPISTDLNTISLPDSIELIKENGFAGLSSSSSGVVNIPNIESWCKIEFENQESNPLTYLHHLKIMNTDTSIIKVPINIEKLLPYCFSGGNFQSIQLHSHIKAIDSTAFSKTTIKDYFHLQNYPAIDYLECHDDKMKYFVFSVDKATKDNLGVISSNTYMICPTVKDAQTLLFYEGTPAQWKTLLNDKEYLAHSRVCFQDQEQKLNIDIADKEDLIYWHYEDNITHTNIQFNNVIYNHQDEHFLLKRIGIAPNYSYRIVSGPQSGNLLNQKTFTIPKAFLDFESNLPTTPVYDQVFLPVTSIGENAFLKLVQTTEINIPTTVEEIYANAFEYAPIEKINGLKKFKSWTTLKRIGASSFASSRFKEVDLSAANTSLVVEKNAFGNIDNKEDLNLVSIGKINIDKDTFGERKIINLIASSDFLNKYSTESRRNSFKTIKLIDEYSSILNSLVLSNCNNLVSFDGFDTDITSIPAGCFKNSKKLADVRLPQKLKTISNEAFFGCTALRQIKLPSLLNSIGQSAFEQCTELRGLSLPISVKTIGERMCKNCTKLMNINISKEIAFLPAETFYGCQNLKIINFLPSLKRIGAKAFWGSSIQQLNGYNIILWDQNALEGCNKLKKLIIGPRAADLGNSGLILFSPQQTFNSDLTIANYSSLPIHNIPTDLQIYRTIKNWNNDAGLLVVEGDKLIIKDNGQVLNTITFLEPGIIEEWNSQEGTFKGKNLLMNDVFLKIDGNGFYKIPTDTSNKFTIELISEGQPYVLITNNSSQLSKPSLNTKLKYNFWYY